jgi:hypothetical protein
MPGPVVTPGRYAGTDGSGSAGSGIADGSYLAASLAAQAASAHAASAGLISQPPAPAAGGGTVTFDKAGPTSTGVSFTTGPGTWTHDNAGNGIAVAVTSFSGTSNLVTGVTYGGVTVPLSVSVAGAGSVGTPVTAFTSGLGISAAVPGTTSGGLVISAVCQGAFTALTATAPNVNRLQLLGSNSSASDDLAIGTDPSTGATVTPAWACVASDFWGMVAVEIIPAPAAPAQAFIHPQSARARLTPGALLARRVNHARSSSGPAPRTRAPWVRAPRTRSRTAPAQLPSVNIASPPPGPPESPPPAPPPRRGGFLAKARHQAASPPAPPVTVPAPYPPSAVRPPRRWPLRRYGSARRGTVAAPGPVLAPARRVPETRVRRPGAAGPPVTAPVLPPALSLSTARRRLWLPRADRGSAAVLPAPPPVAAPQPVPLTARRKVWPLRLRRGSVAGPPPVTAAPPPPAVTVLGTVRRRGVFPRADRGSVTVPVPPPPAVPPPVAWVPQAARGLRRLISRTRPPAAPPAPARLPRAGAVSPRRPARGPLRPRPRAAAPVPPPPAPPPAPRYVPAVTRRRAVWRFLRRLTGAPSPPPVLIPPPPPPAVSAAGTGAGVPYGAWAAGEPHGASLGAAAPGGRWQTRGVSGTAAGAGPPRGSWSAASPYG